MRHDCRFRVVVYPLSESARLQGGIACRQALGRVALTQDVASLGFDLDQLVRDGLIVVDYKRRAQFHITDRGIVLAPARERGEGAGRE